MPRKLPALHLYTGDWLKDPCLRKCSLRARGLWIDVLCYMHEDNQSGLLSGTVEELSRLLNVSEKEFNEIVNELSVTQTLRVTHRNARRNGKVTPIVTLINRRMHRASKANKNNALRQRRHRLSRQSNGNSNGKVTAVSQTLSSSSSISCTKNPPITPPELTPDPVTISDPAAEFEAAKKAMDNAKPETGLPAEGQVHAILCLFQALHRDKHDADSYLIQPWDKRNLKDALEYADFYELERKVRQYFKRRLKQHTVKGLLGLTGKKDEAEEVEFALY